MAVMFAHLHPGQWPGQARQREPRRETDVVAPAAHRGRAD